MKAIIDRFEGDFAVVLFGREEIRVDVPRQLLPAGAREGSWLKVGITLDLEGTQKQEVKIKSLLEKLKHKQP